MANERVFRGCRARVSIVGMALALLACGGGGAGQDLAVTFSYGGSSEPLYSAVNRAPQLAGLNGNAPRCAVVSGSLPPGISLTNGCVLAGIPTAVGRYSAAIALTVDGFGGSVSAPVNIDILAPRLAPIGTPTPSDGQSVSVGYPIANFPVVTIDTILFAPYVPPEGVDRLFQVVSGAPPQGLTLDPATGTFSGLPTGFGSTSLSMALTLQYAGTTFTTPAVTVNTRTVQAPWTLTYPACCAGNAGDDITRMPSSTYQPVAGSTVTFQWVGLPPEGVMLDAATGVISGWLGTGGGDFTRVVQSVTFPDGSVQSAESIGQAWEIAAPTFDYFVFTETTFAGQLFSFPHGPIGNVLPGDVYVFSMIDTPGSTPVPAWLDIDPMTGTLFGIGVAPAFFAESADVTVVLTITRNGHSFTSRSRLTFSLQP